MAMGFFGKHSRHPKPLSGAVQAHGITQAASPDVATTVLAAPADMHDGPSNMLSLHRSEAPSVQPIALPWIPPLIERSDFLVWTRRRQLAAPAELIRLAELAIALGCPTVRLNKRQP
jgi:hypothetical protein